MCDVTGALTGMASFAFGEIVIRQNRAATHDQTLQEFAALNQGFLIRTLPHFRKR